MRNKFKDYFITSGIDKYSAKVDLYNRALILIGLALFAVTLAVYWQVGDHVFFEIDDAVYVSENTHIANGVSISSIIWAFSSVDAANWHPLTWLSHMLDVQFYGMNPRGHHLTNVFIHAVSTLLLLLLLFRLTKALWQSSFIAALFALHPMHVESVAWVSERKDVLSAFFWFLTLFLYALYAEKRTKSLYRLTLFSFVLGLMSKPMLVTLPVIMLLLDFWPLKRLNSNEQETECSFLSQLKPLIIEKVPFLVCSLLSSAITIYAQNKGGAVSTLDELSFQLRLENVFIAYIKYIFKTVWPSDLAVLYPFSYSMPLWQVICSLLLLLLISVATIRAWRCHPYLPVGWFWFLITLLPVIGLIQVGKQSMADRYSYIPQTGLFIMAAWGAAAVAKEVQQRRMILVLISITVIISSTVLTWRQLGYWQDKIALYQHTLDVTADNYMINNSLGLALASKGNLDGAIEEYRKSLRINSDYFEARNNLGLALYNKGELDAAIQEYKSALRITPYHHSIQNNLGLALYRKGELDAAIQEYQKALRIKPDYAEAHNNLGLGLADKGDLDSAIREYQEAFRIKPDYSDAHYNMGNAYLFKGYPDAAIQEYQKAIALNPDNVDARTNLRVVLERELRN